MIYLFIGQDTASKDIALNKLKAKYLAEETRHYNLDTLYARDLSRKYLQEKLLSLPFKSDYRVVVIKEARYLKQDVKEFFIEYVKKPYANIILVIDMDKSESPAGFINSISRYANVSRFNEEQKADTFMLNRQIKLRKTNSSLKILNRLLKTGERPERILGGLRYAWQKECSNPAELKKKMKFLLDCDLAIKTGKLKPAFVLERMVVALCCGS